MVVKKAKFFGRVKKGMSLQEQDAYLQSVQGLFKAYCFHVHNSDFANNKGVKELKWKPSRFHKDLCDRVQEFVERPTDKAYEILVINSPPQHGKLCADDTPVLTRNGWKNHGDLVVGDEVISPSGKFVKVINVLPKQYANRLVTLTNGEQIKVHENHEWVVYDRSVHKERVVETKYIEKRVSYGKQEKKRGHRYNFMIPLVAPLDCEEKPLAVDPYVLGVWLGDGTNIAGHICAAKADRITLDEVRKHYRDGSEWIHKDTGVITASYKGLYKDLQCYGMCYSRKRTEKHIPQEYLTASKRQRLELLAGLIDTDGYVDHKHNRIVFTTADEYLRFSFEELIATFGWRTTTCECKPILSTSGIQGKKAYWQIAFNPTEEIPCRIYRKKLKTFSKQRRISICAVEPIPEERGNCITVDGGVYCVGKKLVPTHNSVTLTETLPSWYIMKHPDNSVIQVSYGDDLAERFGKRNLEKVREFGNIFGVSVDPKKATSREFQISGHKGRMISKGIGSGLTGHSGHLIIIDDPIKNREQADSERTRNAIWSEFTDSIISRTQAGSKIVLIMTRWHEDDLAGRILSEMPDITTHINYECECEDVENDPLNRKEGEALCPEIGKGKEWLNEFKSAFTTEQGMRSWQALYQGHPTIQEGNILKKEWWQYYEPSKTPKFDQMIMSVDATFKDGDRNDFVAISVWGKVENKIYLVKMINEHLNFNATLHKIRLLKAHYPRIGAVYVEDAANGQAIMQTLSHEILGIIAVPPDKSKEARVNAVSFFIEAGNVYLPNGDPIVFKFVEQCAKFPNDKHDDMVDSMSMALMKLGYSRKGRMIGAIAGKVNGWTLPSQKPKKNALRGNMNVI